MMADTVCDNESQNHVHIADMRQVLARHLPFGAFQRHSTLLAIPAKTLLSSTEDVKKVIIAL